MSQTLDINTERGRLAAADQLRATEIVFGSDHEFAFLSTAMTGAAAADGFIVKSGTVTGIAEVKSRDMDYAKLFGGFKAEWLVSFQKLLDVQSLSKLLRIPSYGLLYLVPSAMVLVVRFTDSSGDIVCQYRVEETKTKASCNGGQAIRENAFIKMDKAKIYKER